MKPSLSPAQEAYKQLDKADQDLMSRFGLDQSDLVSDAYFKSMIVIMKRIEKLESYANLPS